MRVKYPRTVLSLRALRSAHHTVQGEGRGNLVSLGLLRFFRNGDSINAFVLVRAK